MPKVEARVDPELAPVANEDDWELDTSPLDVRPRLGASLSLRLDPEDARLVRKAARAAGISQSEFIRIAARARATEVLAANPIHVSIHPGESAVIAYVDETWIHELHETDLAENTTPKRIDWSGDPHPSTSRRRVSRGQQQRTG